MKIRIPDWANRWARDASPPEVEAFSRRLQWRALPTGGQICQVEKSCSLDAFELADMDLPIPVTVSTSTVDRYGDIIEPTGWRTANYSRNPVWLVDHSYRVESIVGVGMNPRSEGPAFRLDFRPDPAGSGKAVDMVRAKLMAGSLRAVSVGFAPLKWEKILDEKNEWTGGFRYLEQDLLENSWVAVPANPSATLDVDDPDPSDSPAVDAARQDEAPVTVVSTAELHNALAAMWAKRAAAALAAGRS